MIRKGAGVIIIRDGKILLVKAGDASGQINGTISFPGGKVEPNETEKQAAMRELTEESGLVADDVIEFPGNYVEATLTLKEGVIDYSFKVYIAQEFTGDLSTSDETEPFWEDLQVARKTKLLGAGNELLENAIKYLGL